MENHILKNALIYAKNGLYVFPCREKESRPFLTKSGKQKTLPAKSPYFKGGFQSATRDESQIKEWWEKHPEAGIGISCGHSELIVVDIDTHKGNRNGFDTFMSLNVSDDGALHSSTPSGGMHIVFKGLTNSYANVKDSIDLRSQGSYIVAPPSHIYDKEGNKKRYIALDDWSRVPEDAPIELVEKLNLLRKKSNGLPIKSEKKIILEDISESLKKAERALRKLSPEYYDERWKWINVGLALKTIGEEAFYLWDTFSAKSSKYNSDDCRYVWDKFVPREIGLGSLMVWAYGDRNDKS